ADEAAIRGEYVEVERLVRERRRQYAAGRAAGEEGIQLVAVRHAASELDQLARADAVAGEVDAGTSHATAHAEVALPRATAKAPVTERLRPCLENRAQPVRSLDVLHECRPAKDACLCREWRTEARLPPLPLRRLDQCGLLAADVGTGAAAQLDWRQRARRILRERRDLTLEDRAHHCILVTQVDHQRAGADAPRREQRLLEDPERVRLQAESVLERARLTLIPIACHTARSRCTANELPLAMQREARAAESAKAACLYLRNDVLRTARTTHAFREECIAAVRAIRRVVRILRDDRLDLVTSHCVGDGCSAGALDRVASDNGHRCTVATADTRRRDHADTRTERVPQRVEQLVASGEVTGDRVADADGDRRWRDVALLHDVEMVVERRHLVGLRRRQPELEGEGVELRDRQVAVVILQQVKVLDEQVRPPGPIAQQRLDGGQRRRIDRSALGRRPQPGAGKCAAALSLASRHRARPAESGEGFSRKLVGAPWCRKRLQKTLASRLRWEPRSADWHRAVQGRR